MGTFRRALGHRRRFLLLLALPFLMLAAGTGGYMLIERWDFLDALYMAVITLTTVGYLEVHPLGPAGRVFTMAYLLAGVYSVFWAATALIQAAVSGEIRGDFGRQRMERRLAELQDHAIVCGLGRMGHLVCAEFSAEGCPSWSSTVTPRCSRPSRWPTASPSMATPPRTRCCGKPGSSAPACWSPSPRRTRTTSTSR